LTRRERDVLALLARGFSNKRIGERLGISEHTAKFHVGSVLAKLGAATRAEAVALGVRRGYVVL
jgi:DNA-binding CsgD family transcriptional regulator